jgi:hypothetical protein
LEIRRLDNQLAALEENARHARMVGPSSTVWRAPEVYQREIDAIDERLRALLAAGSDPEQDE